MPAAEIEAFAKLYGTTQRSFIRKLVRTNGFVDVGRRDLELQTKLR